MYLLIVARHQPTRYEEMVRACAGRPEITVILDRRAGERPAGGRPSAPERRARPEVDDKLRTVGWALVELPSAAAAPAGAPPPAAAPVPVHEVPEPVPRPAPRRRLLVVDDDPRITDILSKHFGATWEVEVARDGAVGLAKTILRRPEVILLDLGIPLMDGLTVLRHVHNFDPTIPVIMITGNEDVELAGESLRSGLFSYVPKPFDLHYLDLLVAAVTERRSA